MINKMTTKTVNRRISKKASRRKSEKIILSIIIVGYNVEKWLVICLNSIFKNQPDIHFEVIYIDNGSQDATLEKLSCFKCIKIVKNSSNLGFTKACNQGAAVARGKYLLFLNSDTEILDGSLEKMVDYLEKNHSAGVIGPRLFNNHQFDLQISSTGDLTPVRAIFSFSLLKDLLPHTRLVREYLLSDWQRNSIREVGAVSGAALMIRNSIFKKINGFDEQFFLYFDESDLCLRVKNLGKKIIFYPEAKIIHYGGKTTEKMPAEAHQFFLQSRFKFFKKHYGLYQALFVEFFLRPFEFLAKHL